MPAVIWPNLKDDGGDDDDGIDHGDDDDDDNYDDGDFNGFTGWEWRELQKWQISNFLQRMITILSQSEKWTNWAETMRKSSKVLGKSEKKDSALGIFDYAFPVACIPPFPIDSIFNFPLCLFFQLKPNCQVDNLDWILEPVEPRHATPKIIYFHSIRLLFIQRPTNSDALPLKKQILSFNMKSSCEELIRKTRPIIGQILIITAGLYFPDGTLPGVNEGQVDERTEPHLEFGC